MTRSTPSDRETIARLRAEVDTLRLANAAVQEQMSVDAARTDVILRTMEAQATALQEANRRHAAQADFTRRVMDTTSAVMVVLDPDGRIRQVNHSFTLDLGIPETAAVGRAFDAFLMADERAILEQALPALPWPVHSPFYELVRIAGEYAAEHRLIGADGASRIYLLEASLQHDPRGKEEGAVVCATDITVLKTQQEALQRNARLLREAQRIAQLGHWDLDLANREMTASEEVVRILEVAEAPRGIAGWLALVHAEDRDDVRREIATALRRGARFDFTFRLALAGGRVKWVQARGNARREGPGRPLHVIGTFQDVTSQRRAAEKLSIAASVFQSSLNGVVVTDADTRILEVNRAFTRILGYPAEEVVGRKTSTFNSRHHDVAFFSDLWEALNRDGEWQGEIWDRRKDGEVIPLWQSITALRDAEGRVKNYVGVFSDLSDQKRSAAHIHHLAYFDVLTDLPNRQLFNDRCAQALAEARRTAKPVALFFLDLDRFKYVNDTLGHPVGDELLCKVAARLTRTLRRNVTVARLGGDEFVVLMRNCAGRDAAERLARRIIALFEKPFAVSGHRLDVKTSIGISVFPDDAEDAETLLKFADLAMYQAKEQGRGKYMFYEVQFTEQIRERMFLESELRDALERDELTLAYQPQFDLATGRIVGCEALLRWTHPVRGPIPPSKFIPIAEDGGLIVPIGEWVLREASRRVAGWIAAGLGPHRLAVNLSGAQIERSDVVAMVTRVLAETGLPVDALELEVTETYLMRKAEQSVRVLEDLRDLGLGLAIDDFGTGHSSLAYLQRLPVDKLKLDRSFVTDLPDGASQAAIARAVVALGHSLHLKVLAEGVETAEQADFLREQGCDEVQGYLYGRPMSPLDLEALLIEQYDATRARCEHDLDDALRGLRDLARPGPAAPGTAHPRGNVA